MACRVRGSDGDLLATVERKTLENVASSLSGGTLAFQMALTDPIHRVGPGKHRNAPAVDVADTMPLTITTLTDVQQHPLSRIPSFMLEPAR